MISSKRYRPTCIVFYSPLRLVEDFAVRRFGSNEAGASAVEFAVVVPVYLVFVLGILAYGIYFGASHSTAQLAADAARASVAGLTDSERSELALKHVARNAASYPLLDSSAVEAEAGPMADDATQFRVVVRYDSSQLPIWGLVGFLPLPNSVIERTATIKRGGY